MEASKDLIEAHAIIHGTVQGVGFRRAARRFALAWNIKGSAENLPDGTVEVYAQGKREAVEAFFSMLKAKFHVTSCALEFLAPKNVRRDFII